MKKAPFGPLTAAIVALGVVLGFLALQLRADGYEQYVGSVANASCLMYFTAAMVVVTWVRDRRTHSN
ncbi:membrane protein [Streptomyces hygroscopicus]|uniref:SCO3870 family protein n=1 Tax=Streptomyces hygroscopicus TaxID=1912 RepID=UPI002240D954|nr:SCO3870 family protein [Streptomyces hygroscopicus]MCW7940518.1 membrane protein [Streptomyces hygroscopicus]